MAVLAMKDLKGQPALYHAMTENGAQVINAYANLLRDLGDRLSNAQRIELATPRGSDGGLGITHMLQHGSTEAITAYGNLLNLLDEKACTCALTANLSVRPTTRLTRLLAPNQYPARSVFGRRQQSFFEC